VGVGLPGAVTGRTPTEALCCLCPAEQVGCKGGIPERHVINVDQDVGVGAVARRHPCVSLQSLVELRVPVGEPRDQVVVWGIDPVGRRGAI
jgi:hypothetical protein